MDDFITIAAPAADITTSGTSARIQIPNDSAGNLPRYIRVVATAAARVRLGDSTVTAVASDTLVQPADSTIVSTNGRTYIAAIQDSAAGKVNVSPLENS
jgi:hypothetical protein